MPGKDCARLAFKVCLPERHLRDSPFASRPQQICGPLASMQRLVRCVITACSLAFAGEAVAQVSWRPTVAIGVGIGTPVGAGDLDVWRFSQHLAIANEVVRLRAGIAQLHSSRRKGTHDGIALMVHPLAPVRSLRAVYLGVTYSVLVQTRWVPVADGFLILPDVDERLVGPLFGFRLPLGILCPFGEAQWLHRPDSTGAAPVWVVSLGLDLQVPL